MKYRIVIEIDSSHERETINEMSKALGNQINAYNSIELIYLATEEVVNEKRNIFKDKD